jgi:hypothetical protein
MLHNFLFRFLGSVEKYGGARQGTDDSIIWRMNDAICMPGN